MHGALPPVDEETPAAPRRFSSWFALLRPGDWLTAICGLAGVLLSFPVLWSGGNAERAVIRVEGRLVAEYPLTVARRHAVTGAIGETVIEIAPGRARVLSDPGPRQYCVQQGWLSRPHAIAICAPNHVSLSLSGGNASHDSLNY